MLCLGCCYHSQAHATKLHKPHAAGQAALTRSPLAKLLPQRSLIFFPFTHLQSFDFVSYLKMFFAFLLLLGGSNTSNLSWSSLQLHFHSAGHAEPGLELRSKTGLGDGLDD